MEKNVKKPKTTGRPTGRPNGRPSSFTDERAASILEDIACHVPYILAAEANGICEDTLYEWINRGKRDKADGLDTQFSRFSENIKRTEVNRIKEHTQKIFNNVERWQSDAWLLERRWYKHFGANAQLNELNARLDKLEQGENDAGQLHRAEEKASKVKEGIEDANFDGEE